ncbi:MAG: hypothetical protein Phyf2KO_00800 [Phycisphaerales bacterium]
MVNAPGFTQTMPSVASDSADIDGAAIQTLETINNATGKNATGPACEFNFLSMA